MSVIDINYNYYRKHISRPGDSRNVVITIVSQSEPYHTSVATRLKEDIYTHILEHEKREPSILITHEDLPRPGAWTIFPLFKPLLDLYRGTDVRWIVFLEPHTAVRANKLLDALESADKKQDIMWIGYPLSDEEPSIIHHFKMFTELEDEGGFVFPNFASGFAMRLTLIENVIEKLEEGIGLKSDHFSIDPAFELAQLVYTTTGVLMTADLNFCVVSADHCATYPRQFDICGSVIPESAIYFAVKTWSGFHDKRVRIVKKTWGKHLTNLMFYSDLTDPKLPSMDIGIPNSKVGHCAKTVAILKAAVKKVEDQPHIKWIFLADDDTILGLCEVLSCYRGGDAMTALGERYGFGYLSNGTGTALDYLTGGAGLALSPSAARLLSACSCSVRQPDDMILGACARDNKLPLTHSPHFHQYRPTEYHRDVLARDRPVSFHGLRPSDETKIYSTWFQHHDNIRRDEL